MPVCSVLGCSNRSGRKSAKQKAIERKIKVTFHAFPKNEQKKNAWLKAIGRIGWSPTKGSALCSEHFTVDCFDRTSLCYIRLRESAVPTILKPAHTAIFKQELPASICPKCHSRIRKIFKFKKMCMRNACRLSEYINILKKRSSDKKFNDIQIVLNRDQFNLENEFDTDKNVEEPVILYVGQDWHENYGKFNIGVNYNTQIIINNSELLAIPESSKTTKHAEQTNLPAEKLITHIKEEITESADRQLDPEFVNECNSIITEYFQEAILPLENETVYIKEEIIDDENELLSQENDNIEFVQETVLPEETPTIYIKEETFDVKEETVVTNNSGTQVDEELLVKSSRKKNHNRHKSVKFKNDYKNSPVATKRPHSSQKDNCSHSSYVDRSEIVAFCKNLAKYPDSDRLLLKCKICASYFGSKKNLQEHIRTHFKCVLCVKKGRKPRSGPGYGYLDTDNKGELIGTLTNNVYKCEICDQMFALEARLKEHKRSHGVECTVCDMTFANNISLGMHMNTHLDVLGLNCEFKKFECEQCDQKFALEANRSLHMIYHLDAICSFCGITFSSKPSLLRHMQIHSIEKKYECKFCKKQFVLKDNLHTHLSWCNKNTNMSN